MQLPSLTNGRMLSRYKRFFADVKLEDGSIITAHCPNTGRMTSCWEEGAPVQISHSDNPKRKLPWTLERVDMGQGWIGVNTARTNGVVAEAIGEGRVPGLSGYPEMRREVVWEVPGHPRSRLDLSLAGSSGPDVMIEVKNVTLYQGGCLQFPDAVSLRARKHLELLQQVVKEGMRGVILFALNRPEGDCFRAAREIDPGYADALAKALASGVEALALRLKHTPGGIVGGEMVEVRT
jgi:sugar fermentation stimulation protein A